MKKRTDLVNHTKNCAKVITPDEISEIKLSNIINMALDFSGMIRLFKKDSKAKLYERTLSTVKQVFKAESEEEFKRIHSKFCECLTNKIVLAKKNQAASYGQIAKTLNVVLKVAVYYCHLPEYEKSKSLLRWLDAAVDNRMMRKLKQPYRAIHEVKRDDYSKIQDAVRKFIREKHQDTFLPVHFDDCYFQKPKWVVEPFWAKDC
jgi:hypothetical protein